MCAKNQLRHSEVFRERIDTFCDKNKQNLVFIFPNSLAMHGHILNEKPLGGSETSLIHIAKGLANDFNCIVFCSCPKPGIYDNVLYLGEMDFGYIDRLSVDIAVVCKMMSLSFFTMVKGKTNPKKFIFWAHDYPMYEQYGPDFPIIAKLFDAIVCVSNDHKNALLTRYPYRIPGSKVYAIRQGVDMSLYTERDEINKVKNQFYYSSTPFRGLEILVDVFPKIRERVPDATLKVCSSLLVYDDSVNNKFYHELYDKCKNTDGIEYIGSIKQRDLAKVAMESELMLYPSIFAETCCISALEAQAAGTPVISNDLGALKETNLCGCGIKMPGNPFDKEWQKKYIDAVISICENRTILEGMKNNCLKQNFDWDISIKKWNMVISTRGNL